MPVRLTPKRKQRIAARKPKWKRTKKEKDKEYIRKMRKEIARSRKMAKKGYLVDGDGKKWLQSEYEEELARKLENLIRKKSRTT